MAVPLLNDPALSPAEQTAESCSILAVQLELVFTTFRAVSCCLGAMRNSFLTPTLFMVNFDAVVPNVLKQLFFAIHTLSVGDAHRRFTRSLLATHTQYTSDTPSLLASLHA